MTMTLKEVALAYEPKKTLNIADLESFDISEPMGIKEGEDKDGKKFSYYMLLRDGKEYRVPNIVLETIKSKISTLAKYNKELKTVTVEKSGEGMATKYQVIELD